MPVTGRSNRHPSRSGSRSRRSSSPSCAAGIEATRWPSAELVADRSQGVQLATLQALARHWATEYDWRRVEARLNALPQFTTEIDGVEIHFIHVRSRHENALPLVMTHGWPGSVIELLDTVGPLTDPTAHGGTAEDAFHLVLPSLPGLRLLGRAGRARLGRRPHRARVGGADAPPRLHPLRRPGRRRRCRSSRTRWAARRPEGLAGIHLNLLAAALGLKDHLPAESEQERAAREAVATFRDRRLRLLPGAVHPAADDRLLAAGFTHRAGGLAARPRHGQLRQDLPRVRRRRARGQPHPRQHPRQHHAVLADGHRRLGRPVVLGVRTSAGRSARVRRGASAGLGSGRLHDVPRRDLGFPSQLGRGGLPGPQLTSTRSTAAATSPPGRSRSSSPPRCGPHSAHCADDETLRTSGTGRRVPRNSEHLAERLEHLLLALADAGPADPEEAAFLGGERRPL